TDLAFELHAGKESQGLIHDAVVAHAQDAFVVFDVALPLAVEGLFWKSHFPGDLHAAADMIGGVGNIAFRQVDGSLRLRGRSAKKNGSKHEDSHDHSKRGFRQINVRL